LVDGEPADATNFDAGVANPAVDVDVGDAAVDNRAVGVREPALSVLVERLCATASLPGLAIAASEITDFVSSDSDASAPAAATGAAPP
jgi:hypothetical protein